MTEGRTTLVLRSFYRTKLKKKTKSFIASLSLSSLRVTDFSNVSCAGGGGGCSMGNKKRGLILLYVHFNCAWALGIFILDKHSLVGRIWCKTRGSQRDVLYLG